ncbi:MAG: undecaprenyldiphospho-muramoylpentapeptide beta-N-acetylglucosaminyltransferase [Candidatus Marinimicrobia bacterium]|jgi:UDP-N-acetylglucosamine--N-acetylmuramyl-(pentapeptide) pyrophosphoryl-undecaprenol N-acetylglucosamine transferase|nr:undecaprenyldiphospho-muramoylpentapeptide beta-N-acetylglucosaminyltransferase [Candidatus Neomarinimicrobiota bacterium]MDP6991474.1 undecaprenyldiphospho-muramoylpentapeptide beta-N-acetylglucosaminyltransferase [Candidatus Neomarinimicrobiota bacterium]
MASPMQIIITGGGTGGHLFPALAIGDEIMERHPNALVHYVGSTFGIEKDVLPVKNVAHSLLPIRGLQRSLNFSAMGKNLLLPGRLLSSISKVKSLLNDINPNLVIGTGGYASALPLREGIRRGIPTLIQEQNSYPGVTTRWFAEKANRVCIAFEEAQSFIKKKCVLAGNPVRKEINMGDRLQGLSQYGFNDNKNTLFLFGGSQGSLALNQAMDKMISHFSIANIQVIWQTGKNLHEVYRHHENELTRVVPFINDMANAYAASDLVLCRSGAITCSELTVCGKPSILVPFPDAAADHQTKNADALAKHGAAALVHEQELIPEKLAAMIQGLLDNASQLDKMASASLTLGKPDATASIVNQAMELIS